MSFVLLPWGARPVVAATPEVARRVAEVVRRCFAATEQRSYPAGPEGGTLLRISVDTTQPAGPARSWLESSESAFGEQLPQEEPRRDEH
ncbi:hypothetical protein ACE14D_25565 [Streptomyces sp. Act-28]